MEFITIREYKTMELYIETNPQYFSPLSKAIYYQYLQNLIFRKQLPVFFKK